MRLEEFTLRAAVKVVTIRAFAVFAAHNIGLEALTVPLQAVGFLTVASLVVYLSHGLAADTSVAFVGQRAMGDLGAKGTRVSLQHRRNCIVSSFLMLDGACVVAVFAVASIAHIPTGEALAVKLETLALAAVALSLFLLPRRLVHRVARDGRCTDRPLDQRRRRRGRNGGRMRGCWHNLHRRRDRWRTGAWHLIV